jgi:small subunit ribosomal protein S4e
MSKKHLKKINMPKTWDIKRKGTVYIKRPLPGPHGFDYGLALSVVLKDMLKIAKTTKEVKNILNNHDLLIDGVKRKEPKFIVGFLDVISIPKTKENFRIVFNKKGKLDFIKIDEKESKLKLCKINGKRMHKKGLQVNLSDGRNVFTDKKDIKVGDSVLIEFPKQEIKNTLKLEKGALVILIGGKHIGTIATIEEIKDNVMKCKNKDNTFETSKKYAFVIGKEKSLIKVEE